MSEFDFLNEFGKNLDRERPFEAADSDWEKVAAKLDAQDSDAKNRRRLRALFWPIIMGLAFLSTGAVWFHNWQKMTEFRGEIARLKSEIFDSKLPLQTTISAAKSNAFIEKKTVVIYDTIYRTVVIRSQVSENDETFFKEKLANYLSKKTGQRVDNELVTQILAEINSKNDELVFEKNKVETSRNSTILTEKKQAETSAKSTNGSSFLNEKSGDLVGTKQTNLTQNKQEEMDKLLSRNATFLVNKLPTNPLLPLYFFRKNKISRSDLAMHHDAEEREIVEVIRRFKPQNAAISVRGGGLFPQAKIARPLKSWQFGIQGEFAFGQRWHLVGAADFSRSDFKIEADNVGDFQISTPTPPTPNDVLDYVRIKSPFWNYSIGLQYNILRGKQFRPFVSAYWVGETSEQLVEFEYNNQLTMEETYIRIPGKEDRFNANGWQIGVGADYFLSKRWSIGLESIYKKQFSSGFGPRAGEYFGIRMGLKYHF